MTHEREPTQQTFYWYDYETDDSDPRSARPVQFAGQRTDAAFRPVGAPLNILCWPQMDRLPSVDATLIHGISPEVAARQGLSEAAFADAIMSELEVPGTTAVAYNGMRFDHELTRHLCWRTLRRPYRWAMGENARFDPINLLRAACAFRPAGLNWPTDDAGAPSFKLERLAAANDIAHIQAHDALSDVEATIGLMQRLQRAQPRLLTWALQGLTSHAALARINPRRGAPVLYTNSTIPARFHSTTAILPFVPPGYRPRAVVGWDLRHDPTPFLDSDVDALREAVFTKQSERDEAAPRPGVVRLQLNKAPFVSPIALLDERLAQRIGLDMATVRERAALLRERPDFQAVCESVHHKDWSPADDVDLALYDGFVPDRDRARLHELRRDPQNNLRDSQVFSEAAWQDPRLPELVFRYTARNHYQLLGQAEKQRWRAHCEASLTAPTASGQPALQQWMEDIRARMKEDIAADDAALLRALLKHGTTLARWAQHGDLPEP